MQKIYMYVKSFNEDTNTFEVSFASDETKSQNPEDYPTFAFDPFNMWPDVKDVQKLTKLIAFGGIYQTTQQTRQENFQLDPDQLNYLKSLVSQKLEYNVEDLYKTVHGED